MEAKPELIGREVGGGTQKSEAAAPVSTTQVLPTAHNLSAMASASSSLSATGMSQLSTPSGKTALDYSKWDLIEDEVRAILPRR